MSYYTPVLLTAFGHRTPRCRSYTKVLEKRHHLSFFFTVKKVIEVLAIDERRKVVADSIICDGNFDFSVLYNLPVKKEQGCRFENTNYSRLSEIKTYFA